MIKVGIGKTLSHANKFVMGFIPEIIYKLEVQIFQYIWVFGVLGKIQSRFDLDLLEYRYPNFSIISLIYCG